MCTDALQGRPVGPVDAGHHPRSRSTPGHGGLRARRRAGHRARLRRAAATCGCSRGCATVLIRPSTSWRLSTARGSTTSHAPLARWTWDRRDLGFVQEPLADRSGGWALAMTSLRDLYALGGRPEAAGGDFGPEAHALGTMTARMHLALDRAFDRHPEPVSAWVDARRSGDRRGGSRVARGPGDGRSDQGTAGRGRPAARHPHPRRLPSGPYVPHRSGVGGQRLPPRRRPPRGDRAHRPLPPGRRGRPFVVAPPGQPGGRPRARSRPGASTWHRSGRPGRRATAGPC